MQKDKSLLILKENSLIKTRFLVTRDLVTMDEIITDKYGKSTAR